MLALVAVFVVIVTVLLRNRFHFNLSCHIIYYTTFLQNSRASRNDKFRHINRCASGASQCDKSEILSHCFASTAAKS